MRASTGGYAFDYKHMGMRKMISKWPYLWNRSTDFDALTSGRKLLMSAFILAWQPAHQTLTTGATPPPPPLSDNTDTMLIYQCCVENWESRDLVECSQLQVGGLIK